MITLVPGVYTGGGAKNVPNLISVIVNDKFGIRNL